MDLKQFDALFDNKHSIISLYLFFVCFLLRSKVYQYEQQLSQILLYYQEGKVQKGKASTSKINYRAMQKLEMKKPFAFSLYYNLDLAISQIGNEMEDRNVRFSLKRRHIIVGHLFLREDNSDLRPFISHTVKNVFVSLCRTPLLYSVLVPLLIKMLILFI